MEVVPITGVGKMRYVGRFARFRLHGSSEKFRPGYILRFENISHVKCPENGVRITVHTLDTRETLDEGAYELMPARPEEFAGKLTRFLVRKNGLGICLTVAEKVVDGISHVELYSRIHGKVPGLIPISELEFIGPELS